MEEREEKQIVSLLLAQAHEPRNFVREASGSCINGKELNHYTSRLGDELQRFLQPAAG